MPLNDTELSARIDALLQADDFSYDVWHTASSATPFEITYNFEIAAAADFPWSNVADPVPYTEAQKEVVRAALAKYEAVLNVTFVESAADSDPTLSFYRSPDLYTDSSLLGGGRGRWRYSGEEWDGHVVFRDYYDLTDESNFNLILHEIGHSLGLKHPGNYDISGGGTTGPYLPVAEDHDKFTVMSYTTNTETGIESRELMLYDVAALQKWWGANQETFSGRTTHRALDSTDLKVIYDVGGKDRIRYDGAETVHIDLREGAFSSLSGVDVAAIAYGTIIENAMAGSGADWLTGNAQGNRLIGRAGDDNLAGGAGADVLKGGKGNDVLVAGKGDDLLIGGSGADIFVFDGTVSEGRNVIRGFGDGVDNMRIDGLIFGDLEISASGQGGKNTKIVLDTGTEIVIKGVGVDLITASDFDFI